MKLITLLLLSAGMLVGCSTGAPEQQPTQVVDIQREPASVIPGSQCELKAKSENSTLFQLFINGEPYNEYYYEKEFAKDLKRRLEKKGRCS